MLRVQDKYFHIDCFKCRQCTNSLARGGFFCKDGDYYCTKCYQDLYGTKCDVCLQFVEGEVVSALGKTYHSRCFTCARCRSVLFFLPYICFPLHFVFQLNDIRSRLFFLILWNSPAFHRVNLWSCF